MSDDTPSRDPGTADGSGPATEGAPTVDRRNFMRVITADGIVTAGRLAGMSGALAGAMIAGARAANESFAALGGATAPSAPTARPTTPLSVPATPPPAPTAPFTPAPADLAVFERLSAGILATSQSGGPPPTGIVRFAWDGTAFRIPGRDATARTASLQRDPFASLTLIDPATGEALLVAGRTRIVHGTEGRDAAAEVLAACGVDLPDGWDRPDARGAPILVVLEPQRCFRRSPADERA
jgi:hypothetical protein